MAKLSGIKETCLTVADVDRSERFYRELFDLPVIEGDAGFRALNIANSQVLLLFARGQSVDPVQLPGGTSLYFHDPDGHLVELLTPGVWSIY